MIRLAWKTFFVPLLMTPLQVRAISYCEVWSRLLKRFVSLASLEGMKNLVPFVTMRTSVTPPFLLGCSRGCSEVQHNLPLQRVV